MNKRLCFCLFIFFTTALVFAFGRRERVITVEVTGIVRMVGAGLLSEIVISGQEREWYVAKDEEYKLIDLQHRTITVEGVQTIIQLRFANGFPAGERYYLERVRVISVY